MPTRLSEIENTLTGIAGLIRLSSGVSLGNALEAENGSLQLQSDRASPSSPGGHRGWLTAIRLSSRLDQRYHKEGLCISPTNVRPRQAPSGSPPAARLTLGGQLGPGSISLTCGPLQVGQICQGIRAGDAGPPRPRAAWWRREPGPTGLVTARGRVFSFHQSARPESHDRTDITRLHRIPASESRPVWIGNLADDVTIAGSAMDGVVQAAEALRSIVSSMHTLRLPGVPLRRPLQ